MLGRILFTIVCSIIGFILFPILLLIGAAVILLGCVSAICFLIGGGYAIAWWYYPTHLHEVHALEFLGVSLGAWVTISLVVALFSGQLFPERRRDAPFDPSIPAPFQSLNGWSGWW